MVGKKLPAAVFLNMNDWGYFLQEFSRKNMDYFKQNISKIKSPLTRAQIWYHVSTYGTESAISGFEQLDMIRRAIQHEDDTQLVSGMFNMLKELIWNVFPYDMRDSLTDEFFQLIRTNLLPKYAGDTSSKGKAMVNLLLLGLVDFVSSKKTVGIAVRWLKKEEPILEEEGKEELTFSQKARRTLIRKIWKSRDVPRELKTELLEAEIKGDESDDAEKLQAYCEAAQPIAEIKKAVFESTTDIKDKRSQHLRNAAMAGFQDWREREMLEEFVDKWFEIIIPTFKNGERRFAEAVFYNLRPSNIVKTPEILAKYKSLQAKIGDDQKYFKKLLSDTIENLEAVLKQIELVQKDV